MAWFLVVAELISVLVRLLSLFQLSKAPEAHKARIGHALWLCQKAVNAGFAAGIHAAPDPTLMEGDGEPDPWARPPGEK